MERGDPSAKRVREAVADHFRSVPEAFADREAEAKRIKSLVLAQVAAALQPSLNESFSLRPHGTLPDKQDLASEVNATLRDVGLCLRCPRTGEPAILVADFKDASDARTGRFRFETRDAHGRKSRVGSTAGFPELELMEDPGRRETAVRRISDRKSSGTDRGR